MVDGATSVAGAARQSMNVFDMSFMYMWMLEDPLNKKVAAMWESIPLAKDMNDQVDRIECWDFILKDDELASIYGNGNVLTGKK